MLFTPAYIFTILLGIGIVSLVGCIALAVFCYRLIIDRGRLLLRLERVIAQRVTPQIGGLASGAYLSDVALPHLTPGADQPPDVLALSHVITSAAQPQVLMFLDSACLYSRALLRELHAATRQPASPGVIIVFGGDPPDETAFTISSVTLLHDPHRQAAPLYGVTATPAGYLVTPTRHTASTLQIGPAALLHLALTGSGPDGPRTPLSITPIPQQSVRRLAPLSADDAAPDIHLTTVSGAPWAMADQRGRPVTLLFIDPDCAPCRDVLAWFAINACRDIVVVSQGAPEDPVNQMAAALPGATLLLQERREAAQAFHVHEVPALYEIDAAGMIGSAPIIGREGLMHYRVNGASHHARSIMGARGGWRPRADGQP